MDAGLREQAEELATPMAGQIRTQQDLSAMMRMRMKSVMERVLDAELDVHLGRRKLAATDEAASVAGDAKALREGTARPEPTDDSPSPVRHRRNGRSKKTVPGDMGEVTLATPRDRLGTFEPLLIPKHQRRIPGFEEKIIALFAKGLSTRDIPEILEDLHGVEVSATLISEATAAIDEAVTAWRSRPIDPVWPIVYFDGIVVPVRGANSRVSQHTIYVAIGVNLEGRKERRGLWLSETEGAKFWLSVLTDLKNRGLQNLFVVCLDGLTGFSEAIKAVDERTKVQLCVVPLVRAAMRYVVDKDCRPVAADLQKIYNAATLVEAETALENFAQAWDEKSPTISKRWRAKWPDIITLFDFPVLKLAQGPSAERSPRPTPSNRSTA